MPETGLASVSLRARRDEIAKRRWRGVAADGREFGFDLEQPLPDGAVFFASESARYVIEQRPEAVLEIALCDAAEVARLGWSIGNLHFPIEVAVAGGERGDGVVIRVPDDPAVRQLLGRERTGFTAVERVFHPMKGGAGEHHHSSGHPVDQGHHAQKHHPHAPRHGEHGH